MWVVLGFVVALCALPLSGYLYQYRHRRGRSWKERTDDPVSRSDEARIEQQLDHQHRTWFG